MNNQGGWTHLSKPEQIQALRQLFHLPEQFADVQEFIVIYLAKCMGADNAGALISKALGELDLDRIETTEHLLDLSTILLKQRGIASIAAQILRLHAMRLKLREDQ